MLWLIAVALAADCATPKDGMLIPVGTVSFDAELALTLEGAAAVASVACAVDPGGPLQVEVHTDSQGSSGYNRAMSQRRADVVRAALEAAGVSAVTAVGRGEDFPLGPNTTAAERAVNRRVEFYLDPTARPPAAEGPTPTPAPPVVPVAPHPAPGDAFCADLTRAVQRAAPAEWSFREPLGTIGTRVATCLDAKWSVSRDGDALYADREGLHLRVEGDASGAEVHLTAR